MSTIYPIKGAYIPLNHIKSHCFSQREHLPESTINGILYDSMGRWEYQWPFLRDQVLLEVPTILVMRLGDLPPNSMALCGW